MDVLSNAVVLAISGKKQAGKSETAKFIRRTIVGESRPVHFFEVSFADPLKQFCMDVLGLEIEQVHGTDDEKNTPVPHLLWENFPVVECRRVYRSGGEYVERLKTGPMTGREVMQYWGGEVLRKANPDVFADGLVRRILAANKAASIFASDVKQVFVIQDLRYPNEVRAIKSIGGYTLRLTRSPSDDAHASETSLDADRFDWSEFDCVYDNRNVSVDDQMKALTPWLRKIGVFNKT